MTAGDPQGLREFYEHAYERGTGVPALVDEDDFMYGQVTGEIGPYLRAGARVLDLGCNDGTLSLYMARRGCTVLGIDLAENAVATARAGALAHGVAGAAFQRIDFVRDWTEAEAFDLVVCSHVIEHVPDDGAFLRQIRLSQKPGGRLVLFTPTVHSVLYRWYNAQGKPFPFDAEVGHLRRYERSGLSDLAGRSGLSVDRVTFLDSPLRELVILPKLLRSSQVVLSLPVVRSAFNGLDRLVARVLCPATICIHAVRRP